MPDHTLTFADICTAIAEGHISADRDGTVYQVNALDLRRYLNRYRALLPTRSTLSPMACTHSDQHALSTCAQGSAM